jgi:hypothetical protein
MKTTITTIAALAVMTTAAIAANVDHELQTGKLTASCSFSDIVNGEMKYDEATNSFKTVKPATIKVDQKRMSTITVDTTGEIDGIPDAIASVDWSNGDSTLDGVRMTVAKNGWGLTGDFTKNNKKGLVLNIEPKAFLLDSDVFTPASNTTYEVTWEATCYE